MINMTFYQSKIKNFVQIIVNLLAWSNFKSKKRFIHKKELAEIFVLFIFSAWFLSGSYLLYVLFIFLTYVFICQLDKPVFHLKLQYIEAQTLYKCLNDEGFNTKKLEHYLEKYE